MRTITLFGALLIASCTALGLTPSLTLDCDAQGTLLKDNEKAMPKLYKAERAAIDAEITLTHGYCHGDLPADQTAASKAVETSTAHIAAVLAIAEIRK